jgi:tRNA threonylcarbamoyladenosine modification (KEOPS) complex Cgi121 subunit
VEKRRLLLKEIDEYSKCVGIVGFRSICVTDVDKFFKGIDRIGIRGVEKQFFSADTIATWEHIYFAVLDTLIAFRNKNNIANSTAVETMLYASAQHQIKVAIETVGIKTGTVNIAVLTLGDSAKAVTETIRGISRLLKAEPDDTTLDLTLQKRKTIMKVFKITESELKTVEIGCVDEKEALVNLVVERMALFAARR